MGIIERTILSVMGVMTREEKFKLMIWTVDRFLASLTVQDRKEVMLELIPKMIDGVDVGEIIPKFMATLLQCGDRDSGGILSIMSRLTREGDEVETSPMVLMMMELIPQDMKIMLPNMPKDLRYKFAARVAAILMDQGSTGLSEEEKGILANRIMEQVKG